MRSIPPDIALEARQTLGNPGCTALAVLGGDGTLTIAHQLWQAGIPIAGIPKAIDNDLHGTYITFGFDSAVALAGGGFKGGVAYGATEDLGYRAAENPVYPHDLNAKLLQILGLDHTRLTWPYSSGRDFRLTDVHGEVIHAILA